MAPPIAEDLVAAVDLGSNSFHLVVARLQDGRLQVLDRIKERVLLAQGLDERGRLDPEAAERAYACLERFRQRLRDVPARKVRAAATNTFRRARQPPDFRARAAAALGHPIEIVSGEEEARLIYHGVRYDVGRADERILVVDIGGGSTEVVVGIGEEPELGESLSMGSATWTNRFFPDGRISKKSMKKATLAAAYELEPVASSFRSFAVTQPFGSSGTCLSLERILQETGLSPEGITRAGLEALGRTVLDCAHLSELKLAGLKDTRRPTFLGGLCVLSGAMDALGLERLAVSRGALREGLLLDLSGRLQQHDIRGRTVHDMASRYQVDRRQVERVRTTAMRLFRTLQQPWGLDPSEELPLLWWAAELLEIGLAVRHTAYHRHGAYLIENSDMPGFSQSETRVLARLVRRHRKDTEPAHFGDLTDAEAARCSRLLPPLRLAARMHRARNDASVPELVLAGREDGLEVTFPEGWLEDHPLTVMDLEAEAAVWALFGKRLEFR